MCLFFFFLLHFILISLVFYDFPILFCTNIGINFYSARSRVRGTLEVYHAFIRDLDASDTSSSTNNEPDWELVNDGEPDADIESAAHTQVSHSPRTFGFNFVATNFKSNVKISISIFFKSSIFCLQ